MNESIRSAVVEYRAAQTDVSDALNVLLAFQRNERSFALLHEALKDVGEALLAAESATRDLALVLALDPDKIRADGDLDALVPPVLDHVEE